MKNKPDAAKTGREIVLDGIGVSPHIAIGPAHLLDQRGVAVPEFTIASSAVDDEIRRLRAAIAKTQKQISLLRQKAQTAQSQSASEVALLLEAHMGMLTNSRLVRGAEETIAHKRINAEAAVQTQINAIVDYFASMADPYLSARVADVREVGSRLLHNLLQQQYNPFADVDAGSIFLAEEITPADAALMDSSRISGFATVIGGAEGHVAIMARALGIAAVLGVPSIFDSVRNGDMMIVDGVSGRVILRPTQQTLQTYRQEVQRLSREARKLAALKDVAAQTLDGVAIKLEANLELPREVSKAMDSGAENIGLFRTEFFFMNRNDLPDEDEQFKVLREMVEALDGRPLTVRTLDVGGEKLAPSLHEKIGSSTNPALGLRAIRLGLREPKLLETQIAAVLRASAFGPVRLLVPMVSSVAQMRRVREHLFIVERRLRRRGVKLPSSLPPLGAMIEIPSAALVADALAKVCDFFSIGSNDLTQYAVAIDRMDDRVAELYDPFHPAVLRLIQFTVAAAWRANIPVSLCGEMAGDPMATALLIGLGLREFSMSPSRLPQVKQAILNLSVAQSIAFAEAVMSKTEESEIAALLEKGPSMEKRKASK